MSQENVEVVREVMALWSEAIEDVAGERLMLLIAADVEIDMSRRVFNPDSYYGHEGLRRSMDEIRDVWEEFQLTPERIVGAGDRVVAIVARVGRGRASGVETRDRSGTVWTLRDGQVTHLQTDLDPREALKAVGLEE